MEKKLLRQKGIANLAKVKGEKKGQKEQIISQLLFASNLWQEAGCIAMIRSTEIELDTNPIMARAFAEGKQVCVPIASPKRVMTFHQVNEETKYTVSKFGIDEPVAAPALPANEIDLIIVPGVVFSTKGYRIGFGGGYYDTYLADFAGKTCSLVFSEQLNDDWQPEGFDIPVDRIFTDSFA